MIGGRQIIAQQIFPSSGPKQKTEFGAPAADGGPIAAKLDEIRGLMMKAQARERKEIGQVGFGVSGTSIKKVPTADAEQSYFQAMEIVKELLKSDDPVILDALRSILQSDPMRDTRDIRFRDSPPPFIDEVNARLAHLTGKG